MVTFDDVMNIPLSKCYLSMKEYRGIALTDSCRIPYYGKYVFGYSNLLRERNGYLTLSLPKHIYEALAQYLSTKFPMSDRCYFEKMTVGDIYLNIPRLSSIPRCGRETAYTIIGAFMLLRNRLSDFGIKLGITHWEDELNNWKKYKSKRM